MTFFSNNWARIGQNGWIEIEHLKGDLPGAASLGPICFSYQVFTKATLCVAMRKHTFPNETSERKVSRAPLFNSILNVRALRARGNFFFLFPSPHEGLVPRCVVSYFSV